jgi:hypothetical protein
MENVGGHEGCAESVQEDGNVIWTVVILGHVECRQGQKVLDLYLEKFYIREMYPVPVTFMVGVAGGFAS